MMTISTKARNQLQIRSIDARGTMKTILWQDRNIADVRDFDAKGDGVTDDTASLQLAINTVISKGGGVIQIPAGTFNISGPLTVSMGAASINVSIQGAGTNVTIINQLSSVSDIFQIGTVSQEWADNLSFSNFQTIGGNYAFNITNSLKGTYENITITSPVVGLYLRGANERHIFKNIAIEGATLNGISAGNSNGTLGVGSLDIPEMQKCRFEKIRVASTTGGAAITMTSAGGVSVCLHNVFDEILFEGNARNGIEFNYCGNTSVRMLTNEAFSLDTNNTYTVVKVDNLSGPLSFYNCAFNAAESGNQYQYLLNILSGTVFMHDCNFTGASAATHDLNIGNALHMRNCQVNSASSVNFTTNAANNESSFINLRDGGNNIIGITQPFIGFVGDTVPTYQSSTATGTLNNWAPTTVFLPINPNGRSHMWWSGASVLAVTGLVGTGYGQIFHFINGGSGVVTFAHNSGSSTAANRFSNFATSAPTPVAPGGSATWIYNPSLARWIMIEHEQGQWVTPGYAGGNYTGNSSMTWTVDSGDVTTQKYRLSGTSLTVVYDLTTTSSGGVQSTDLQITNAAWGSFTSLNKTSNAVGLASDNGSVVTAYAQVAASGTLIALRKTSAANWSAATNTTAVDGQITFEVS
jgi:Pectate lyase superfamily protein